MAGPGSIPFQTSNDAATIPVLPMLESLPPTSQQHRRGGAIRPHDPGPDDLKPLLCAGAGIWRWGWLRYSFFANEDSIQSTHCADRQDFQGGEPGAYNAGD